MLSKLKPKQLFLRTFLPLVLIGVVLLSFTSWRQWNAIQEQRWQQVLDDAAASCANTDGCSLDARRLATVFHTSAQLALLDEDGRILAQTEEFLLLRDDGQQPVFARLPGLSESDRSLIRETASVDPTLSHDFAAASYARYPYGSVVYPRSPAGAGAESRSVTEPLRLQTEATPASDVLSAALSSDGTLETRAWLPYLREDGAPDSARLTELLAGGKPAWLPWRSERFTVVSAPEGAEAAQLAVYQCWNPLSFVSDGGGTLAVKLISFAALAALLSLCLCAQAALVRRRREGREN